MLLRLALGNSPRLLAHQRGDFAFEIPHASFPRVVMNQIVQRFVGEFDLLAERDAVLLRLARNQEPLRDVNLFFLGVAGEFDDLHAVAQWLRNRIHPVRRRDE